MPLGVQKNVHVLCTLSCPFLSLKTLPYVLCVFHWTNCSRVMTFVLKISAHTTVHTTRAMYCCWTIWVYMNCVYHCNRCFWVYDTVQLAVFRSASSSILNDRLKTWQSFTNTTTQHQNGKKLRICGVAVNQTHRSSLAMPMIQPNTNCFDDTTWKQIRFDMLHHGRTTGRSYWHNT